MRQQYTRDLSQWLWHKRSPFPGAWLAPLQLPGIRALWANGMIDSTVVNLTALGGGLSSGVAVAGIDMSTSWPGMAISWLLTGGDGVPWYRLVLHPEMIFTGALSIGAWINPRSPATLQKIVCAADQGGPSGQAWADPIHYALGLESGSGIFRVLSGGVDYVITGDAVSADEWHLIVGRFEPSTKMSIRIDDGDWIEDTTSIPASIDDSSGVVLGIFDIGANAGTSTETKLAQAWMAGYVIPDQVCKWLYNIQAPLFGR